MSHNPEIPRHCIECDAEIFESMGSCLAGDVLACINGERTTIRERCGICALKPRNPVVEQEEP